MKLTKLGAVHLVAATTLISVVLTGCDGGDGPAGGVRLPLDCELGTSVSTESVSPVASPTWEIALIPTFEGLDAAEERLQWSPLEPKGSRFRLDTLTSSLDEYSLGVTPVLRLTYIDTEMNRSVTILQGDQCATFEDPEIEAIRTPATVGEFAVEVWQVPEEGEPALVVMEFETGESYDGYPIFAAVIANNADDARAFVESLR